MTSNPPWVPEKRTDNTNTHEAKLRHMIQTEGERDEAEALGEQRSTSKRKAHNKMYNVPCEF